MVTSVGGGAAGAAGGAAGAPLRVPSESLTGTSDSDVRALRHCPHMTTVIAWGEGAAATTPVAALEAALALDLLRAALRAAGAASVALGLFLISSGGVLVASSALAVAHGALLLRAAASPAAAEALLDALRAAPARGCGGRARALAGAGAAVAALEGAGAAGAALYFGSREAAAQAAAGEGFFCPSQAAFFTCTGPPARGFFAPAGVLRGAAGVWLNYAAGHAVAAAAALVTLGLLTRALLRAARALADARGGARAATVNPAAAAAAFKAT
jgi:hypothetical protein